MHVRSLSSVLTLFAVAATLVAQAPDRGRGRRDAKPVELKNLTFRTETFKSEAIGRDNEIGVYLPKDYDDPKNKDVKWPLVVWLHGLFEDHMRFHERGGAEVLDQCVGEGKLPPCVFVSANGGRTSMYFNRKDQRWEDLITVDLLEHLNKTYRVSDKREQRAIMGVSMGGMAALRIAFTQPDLFGAVAVHSAAVMPEDPAQLPDRMKEMVKQFGFTEVFGDPIEKEPWQKANPLCLAQALDSKQMHGLRIYFDAGTNDRLHLGETNELLHKVLDKKGIEHTWRLIEGGGHSWGSGFQGEALPHSFAFLGEMFAAAGAVKSGLEGLGGSVGGKGDDEKNGKKDDAKDPKKDAGHDKPDANGRSGGGR